MKRNRWMSTIGAAVLAGAVLAGSGAAQAQGMGMGPGMGAPQGDGSDGYGGWGPGYGLGMGHGMMGMIRPGMGMMGPGMGPGMGHGMMGMGGMGSGMGMGPGMMGMMGPGMGMGPGMMRGWGGGMGTPDCPWASGDPGRLLGKDDVTKMFERRLAWQGNERLKPGKVEEKDDKTIVPEIVTKDNSLVDKFSIDRRTGWRTRVK
jgi:hypothetical protein